jgi:hypothetical protein
VSVQSNPISIWVFPEKANSWAVQQLRLASLSGSLFQFSVFPPKVLQEALVAGYHSQ